METASRCTRKNASKYRSSGGSLSPLLLLKLGSAGSGSTSLLGHELVWNEVLDVVAAHVEAFARVDAIHAALAFEDEVPKPLVGRQTAAALGPQELSWGGRAHWGYALAKTTSNATGQNPRNIPAYRRK